MNASKPLVRLIPAVFALLIGVVPVAQGQLEVKAAANFNHLKLGTPLGLVPAQNQFSSIGITSGSAGPSATGYPGGTSTDQAGTPTLVIRMTIARIGNSFATGVPRYYLGDRIVPPSVQADNSTPAAPGYWREKPVRPGEAFVNPNNSNLVDVAGVNLVTPASFQGTPIPALPPGGSESFYYSPHADRVFASQAGTVEILWVSAAPLGAGGGAWKFRRETFAVSGASQGDVRTIYWTERSFNGPRVNLPGGRINRVNPIYNPSVPSLVAEEYKPLGFVENPDPNARPPEEKRTLWFDKINGSGQLAAYNKEGRILIEYLGAEVSPGKLDFIGADVVELVRSAPQVAPVVVKLGHRVLPRDGDVNLVGEPLLDLSLGGQLTFYGTRDVANGRLIYDAEVENLNPDRVIFYWLEEGDADIHLLATGQTPGLSIFWPKYQDRYLFVWPDNLSEFAHVTTDPDGSSAQTGLQFDSGAEPEIIFQDDGSQSETSFDANNQRLVVNLANSGDRLNRTLLKFTSGSEVWYQAVYSQAETRGGYQEADSLPPIDSTAAVGARIDRPAAKYSLAGSITAGRGYQASAYIDPYVSGITSAETGAIIPVNAVPAKNLLTVRWFERINPPTPAFKAFYVPSKVGRYTVSYPDNLGAWTVQPERMVEERGNHNATLLADGRVLFSGGFNSAGGTLSSAELYDPATGLWRSTPPMTVGGWDSNAVRLKSGKVLVANQFYTSAELFDPLSETWTQIAPKNYERRFASMTLLKDGRVLVAGGVAWTGDGLPSKSCEVFDPAAGTWTPVGQMSEGRQAPMLALLADGKVLAAGGTIGFYDGLASAEIFNPATGNWTPTSAMKRTRRQFSGTTLPNGKVLVAGGIGASPTAFTLASLVPVETTGSPFVFGPGGWSTPGSATTATAALESPVLRVTTAGPVTVTIRHQYDFEWFGNGGGYDGGQILVSRNGGAYVPVPVAGQLSVNSLGGNGWTGPSPGVVQEQFPLFSDGVIGDTYRFKLKAAWDNSVAQASPNWAIESLVLNNPTTLILTGNADHASAELYDPVAGTWSDTAPLAVARRGHTAILMPDGRVLVAGGGNATVAIYSTQVFDPATETWSPAGSIPEGQAGTFTLMDSGKVILAGSRTRTVTILDALGQIVMASGEGTVDLTAAQMAGSIYRENNATQLGYNPNEEHAVKKDNRFYALRDDLNVTSGDGYTSEPFVLVAYTHPTDGRPAMRPFKVLRENAEHTFRYPWTAGSKIQGPMPLPLMQLPLRNGAIANTEVLGTPDPAPNGTAPAKYGSFTLEDRQGYKWVYRGTHVTGSAGTFGMKWYYPMEAAFFIPGATAQPAVGTVLPYLRPLNAGVPTGDAVTGDALTVIYTPTWPENPPSMRVAETLTLPKFGLPDVRNQASAEIYYQQSIAKQGTARTSVTLHDPTRNKAVTLAEAGLIGIPETIRTSTYQGKTYFQGLPPHLQTRFYFDPLASASGSLVFTGKFYDAIAGEDYLDLNVLSVEDEAALVDLAVNETGELLTKWTNAIAGLKTRVETFIEDPSRQGTYIKSSDPTKTYDVGPKSLAVMPDSDSARDSYALTATGQGEGYVTLVFSDGEVPFLTPQGNPPAVKIIKVIPELYRGDLKVRLSTNPLDEKVTLRHSADFAAKPEDYQFEWRWAAPTISGTQPPTYTYTNAIYLGNPSNGATRQWKYVQNPQAALPTANDYSVGSWTLDRLIQINNASHDPASVLPGVVLKSSSNADFTSGLPAEIVFSADLGNLDGFVLYVNGAVALVHANGVQALNDFISGQSYDLRLLRAAALTDLPVQGESLVVVAEVNSQLHFRIFNAAGVKVFDAGESQLAGKSAQITALKSRLSGLWATTNLSTNDKATVVSAAAAITEVDLDQDASTGLSANGLIKQFRVNESFFIKGPNRIEVALYSEADAGISSNVNLRLEGRTKTDQVIAGGSPWTLATGTPTLMNRAIVGGSPTAPLGSPLLVLSDNFFTMRYRPLKSSGNILAESFATQAAVPWSDWSRPALVEGWIKRVLAAINPFNQRMTDLYNNAVDTDVSLLTQAGTKWEGDIALTLDAVADAGLIAIYETVLNRGKGLSIDSPGGYDYGPANQALLLAAGYLSDLYTIIGDEAYADAANPTISLDDQTTITEVNTSRFSFEGQVSSSLAEELALLRGRDDFLNPQTTQSPFYNRLFWNYTRGINSGEALYAVNYNIKEKAGSSTENGSIDAADAQRMFPQGHGDAYGHYLSALKGYYKLLTNSHFTWSPRIESLNILGNTVSVDYQDERKFAQSAARVAAAAEQVVTLTHRQQYHDNPADGWQHFRDGATGDEFNNARHWGLDEWASRSAQGAYYHWVVGNAMLPDEDTVHTGIQKIDRVEVLELRKLPTSGESFQTTLDNANAHLNPLGLSPGAIAFDISPSQLQAGNSHYEQVYGRALSAVLNAKGSFDQAGRMTRLLRNQENQIADFNTAIEDEERAFNYKLIDLYGSPYPGDIGPGKTYAQSYSGPDLNNWFVVNRPSDFVDTSTPIVITGRKQINIPNFAGFSLAQLTDSVPKQWVESSFTIQPGRFVAFADEWAPGVDLGSRAVTGRLQQALTSAQLAFIALKEGAVRQQDEYNKFDRKTKLLQDVVATAKSDKETALKYTLIKTALTLTETTANLVEDSVKAGKEKALLAGQVFAEYFPLVNGTANDITSTQRGGFLTKSIFASSLLTATGNKAKVAGLIAAQAKEKIQGALDSALKDSAVSLEQKQVIYDYLAQYDEMLRESYEVAELSLQLQKAAEEVISVVALGDRLQLDREIFRKRAATVVQGYRTKDLAFRVFRSEALEQYRTLFDLASRYTYLAAKSYDYETGLLGTPQGQAVFNKIVASRALGDLTNGVPQSTVSTLGDAGLAGPMAQMNADFSVAEGRLGINNPDQYGTVFSLRTELYRLLNDPAITSDDDAWRQTLEQRVVSNVMNDADVATHCRNIRKPDGSAVPGIIIPFSTTIQHARNFFGLPLAAGDHNYSPSSFATKIYNVGIALPGYVGMDSYAAGNTNGAPSSGAPNALSATPYVYLIPCGNDFMLAPPLGDTNVVRSWSVKDQALPLPYNLGATAFNSNQFFSANGTLSEQPWILRKHQAFRMVPDATAFYSSVPAEFTNSRLIARSVWNGQWKIVIPAYTLLNNEQDGLTRFAASVKDIQLFLRTYSHSGN